MPGQRVFTVVSSKDVASISAIASLSRRGAAVAAVVLEGFTDGDESGPAVGRLLHAGVAAIPCVKGELQEALAAIENGVTRRAASRPRVADEKPMDIAA